MIVPPETLDDALRAAGLSSLPNSQVTLLTRWIIHGWPVMVRRPLPTDAPGRIPVGIPLPPSEGKARIALSLPANAKLVGHPPVSVSGAAEFAPGAWSETLAALDRIGARFNGSPCVFGALLWQSLTGLAYLSDGSDLDCLWSPPPMHRAALVDSLRSVASAAPMCLDGEIVFEDGSAVSWRELDRARVDPNGQVIVKLMNGLALRRAAHLLDDRGQSDAE